MPGAALALTSREVLDPGALGLTMAASVSVADVTRRGGLPAGAASFGTK